jgi:sugar fermentation stimulation protein A
MKYQNVVKGIFLSRPNRFIAKVNINGKEETVHVKNTGRCKELLVNGAIVYLSESDNPLRKTKYDLIAVEKILEGGKRLLINMDSQIPNFVVCEFLENSGLFSNEAIIKREVTFENSRFDIFVEDGNKKAFIEVKGVTLEKDGLALFPDAPTERGVKHLRELIKAKKQGYEAYVFFIIQMDNILKFSPNSKMHDEFSVALREAYENGVNILAYNCKVTEDSIKINRKVSVIL